MRLVWVCGMYGMYVCIEDGYVVGHMENGRIDMDMDAVWMHLAAVQGYGSYSAVSGLLF